MAAFTPEEFARCVEILEAIVADRALLATTDGEHRRALIEAAGRISRPFRHEQKREQKEFRRIVHRKAIEHDREARASTEIRTARTAEVFTAPPQLVASPDAPFEQRELKTSRPCYICKLHFTKLHFFYDALCPTCAELNYAKRFQTASLDGRVALITGARLKIGYHAALMMLRAGAHVIVTTRFPRDAAMRFAREDDFATWGARLEIHGLDLRHSPSVELFARYLTQSKPKLDILINNAAQTVRRPPGFYAHMLALEEARFEDLPHAVQELLRKHEDCKRVLSDSDGQVPLQLTGSETGIINAETGVMSWRGDGPGIGIRSSAVLSQIASAADETGRDAELFPVGRTDADLQQVDLRAMNSWRMTLSQVPSDEMLEVQLVNAVAPFILCSKLKPLMQRSPTGDRHIVNVSAMEGQFARRTKTDKHPHTNMAKAALNMMTLTSAPDYAKDGIFMNVVDTGWVTDENPIARIEQRCPGSDFQPPLDIVDGAARICDPFFNGLLTGDHVFGKFLKDYTPTEW